MADQINKTQQPDRLTAAIQENERRREMLALQEDLRRRITIAKNGRLAYENKNHVEAAQCYKKFLAITSRANNVELKDLHPKLFPEKSRVSESLLIAAIAFDLVKIYDQLNTPEANADRAIYFKLLVTFSRGTEFQVFVADNMHRYVRRSPRLKHRKEFQAAVKALGGGDYCFVATAIYESEKAPELIALRKFRDTALQRSAGGRFFIQLYYWLGPTLATMVKKNVRLKKSMKKILDAVVLHLSE